jgi:hypothetical protein
MTSKEMEKKYIAFRHMPVRNIEPCNQAWNSSFENSSTDDTYMYKNLPPLHAMKALRGRGCIAPINSRPRHYMGVSGQRHAPAAL